MRSNIRIIACCIATLIICLIPPALGLNATFVVNNEGSRYNATIELIHTDRYELFESGMLGERIPAQPKNLTLTGSTGQVNISENRGILTFPEGNYTLSYDDQIQAATIKAQFSEPAKVTVIIPPDFSVTNPLLASIQPSGAAMSQANNTSKVEWDGARTIELRYYSAEQENLLYIFAQFWLIIAIILLIPFFLSRK